MKKFKNGLVSVGLGSILPLLFLALWQAGISSHWLPTTLIAGPGATWYKLKLLLGNGTVWQNMSASLFRLFAGFLIGSLSGILLGLVVGVFKTASRLVEPLMLILIPVPSLAWIPLLIIAFGIDEGSKIALLSIGSFCTLFLATSYAVKSLDGNLLELSKLYDKSWPVTLRKIILPHSASAIFGSLRVAMALSWTLLMASEMIAASSGLGWFIWDSRNFSRPDDMNVGIITVGALGWLTDRIIVLTGNYIDRWRIKDRKEPWYEQFARWIWKILLLNPPAGFLSNEETPALKKHHPSNLKRTHEPMAQLAINIKEKAFQLNNRHLPVLKNISLQVSNDEFVSLIGPSGSGKSSLLKIICGLDNDYKGDILFNGQKVTGTSLQRGIVFQEQRLLPWLTVADNISFALPAGIADQEKQAHLGSAIGLVGLAGFENAYPAQLSGGMQQKVALARGLINLPDLLLMDEPFAGLDSITRNKMQQELKTILKKANTTVIMVTHDIDEAITLSSKVIVLSKLPGTIQDTIFIPANVNTDKTSKDFIKFRNQLINELY